MKPLNLGIIPHALLPLSMILGLASPPFRGRGVFWSCIILLLAWLCLIDSFPIDQQMRYVQANAWFFYVPTVQKLICSHPEEAYWRMNRGPAEASRMGVGLKKLWWAAAIIANPRGIGCNYQIKTRPPCYRVDQKARFITRQLLRWLQAYVMVDGAILYIRSFSLQQILEDESWYSRSIICFMCGVLVYSNWLLQWATVAILSVGLGLSAPSDWPPLHGELGKLTTVGYFWGSFWQQILHETVLGYSRTLVRILHIPRKTIWSFLVHLSVAFFISGFFHFLSLWSLFTKVPVRTLFAENMLFFMAQVPAIMLEQMAIRQIAPYINPRPSSPKRDQKSTMYLILAKCVGRLWTLSWLLWSGWWFMDVYFRVGMREWRVPISVLEWVMNHLQAVAILARA